MGQTFAGEKYLKAILKLAVPPDFNVTTNAIAAHLETSAASVTEMLKRLHANGLITYQPYQGATLTESGQQAATALVRRHRLWKVFLVQSLGMAWDEVHEIAGELEHIRSEEFIERLDAFLGHPRFDPHGDPIPNARGRYTLRTKVSLEDLAPGQPADVVGVRDNRRAFLRHLTEKGIGLGSCVTIASRDAFDTTLRILPEGRTIVLSGQAARNVLVKPH